MPFSQIASIIGGSLLAIEPVLTTNLSLPVGASSDFGCAMTFSGQRLVVGAPTNIYDVQPEKIERVYVLDDSDWSLKDTIQYANDTASTRFGSALAVAGTRMVVGAPAEAVLNKKLAGVVYTLEFDGALWTDLPSAKVLAPVPEVGQRFGYNIALDEKQLIIGAPGTNTLAQSDVGAIFVYDKVDGGWMGPKTIFMDTPGEQAGFGTTMALSGDWLAVSAPEGGRESVVMLKRDPQTLEWSQTEELDSQSFVDDGCAAMAEVQVPRTALALQGDTLVVGDPLSNAAPGGGSVYVLRLNGDDWACVARLTPAMAAGEESFGSAVALTDDMLLVGASHHSSEYANQGAIHVFRDAGAEYLYEGTVRGEAMEDGLGKHFITHSTQIAAQISGDNDDVFSTVAIYELRASLGEPCDALMPCAKGTCEAGICCAEPCSGVCFACATEDNPNPGECRFADGVMCTPMDEGCVDNVCQTADTGEDSGTSSTGDGGTTIDDTTSGDHGAENGSTIESNGDLPTSDGEGGTLSGGPGGVGFDSDDLFQGCSCDVRRPAGGASHVALGLLVLLGLRRRRSS